MSAISVTDLLDQALQAERSGRFNEARDKLRQALSLRETAETLNVRLRLGKLLIFAGPPHYGEAEDILTAARAQATQTGAPRQTATAIHLLALLQMHHGRFDEALQLLNTSPVLRPSSAPGAESGQWFHYRGLIAANQSDL